MSSWTTVAADCPDRSLCLTAASVARFVVLCVSVLLALQILGFAGGANAQGVLPSVRIGTTPLLTPTAARGYYGASTTHTVGPGAPSVRPPEIKELARSLNNDPDLIYQFVLNEIDTEFRYGGSKGALGALIDRSGTPFDQANLLVELYREAGVPAQYRSGEITLTAAQFLAWTGISDAKAACQLLAAGAIPGAVNGATTADCAYTGAVASVQLSHLWVAAQIGGTWYLFDPAYKVYTAPAGLSLRLIMGITSGGPLAQATSGMTSGVDNSVPYVRNLNAETLNAALNGYSNNLATSLQTQAPG